MRVVHDEDVRSRIFREIALRDVLPVAGIIGESDRGLVEDLDEALGAAAMLDVGLAVGARGRKKEAVGVGEESSELVVDLGAPAAIFFDMGIGLARSLARLDRLYRRRERDVARIEVRIGHRKISS